MLRKPLFTLLLAVILGVGFAYGITRLFAMRYELGDVYPPYSTLRADPLGTKALVEALAELPGVEVRRNFKPLQKLRPGSDVTLIYTGAPRYAYWTQDELLAFETMVARGSRAVFTFFPMESAVSKDKGDRAKEDEREKKEQKLEEEPDNPDDPKEKKSPDTAGHEGKPAMLDFDEVAKRWGLAFDFLPEPKERFDREAALVEPGGRLEPQLSWHSALCFRDLKPEWKVLYVCDTLPVIVERKYGAGSIVLVADSYLVSNEALSKERHSRLLARLLSGPPLVIFDEESRGIREQPGIASLIRKYRLHGVIAGLVLLAALFVWKNIVRFIPTYDPTTSGANVVVGKDSSEGFVNLLRRSIRPAAIFETCVTEWRKAFLHQPRELAKIEEICAREKARPRRDRDPVAAYREISSALSRKS